MDLVRLMRGKLLHYYANALQSCLGQDQQKNKQQQMSLKKYQLDGSERSMIPVIKTDAYMLLDGNRSSDINALEEFSAGTGISDVTLFCIDKNIIKQRVDLDKTPLTSKVYIELMLFIASKGKAHLQEIEENFQKFYSIKTLRNHLDTLVDKNILIEDAGSFRSLFNYDDLRGQKVIAIEAKVKDWRSGVRQAMRYQEYADYSYLAIYENHIQNCLDNIVIFEKLGLGLIGVSNDGLTVHLRAKKSEYQQLENKILAFERFISIFDSRYDSFEVRNNLCRQA